LFRPERVWCRLVGRHILCGLHYWPWNSIPFGFLGNHWLLARNPHTGRVDDPYRRLGGLIAAKLTFSLSRIMLSEVLKKFSNLQVVLMRFSIQDRQKREVEENKKGNEVLSSLRLD